MALLNYAGRRTIMLYCNILIAIILLLIGYLDVIDDQIAVIILIMVFISLFEFGPGPVTWLYMAEIM